MKSALLSHDLWHNAPLHYSSTVDLGVPIPVTHANIRRLNSKFSSLVDLNIINISWLSANQCQMDFVRLGILEPVIPPSLTVFRQMICDFIGAPRVPGVSVPNWDVVLFLLRGS